MEHFRRPSFNPFRDLRRISKVIIERSDEDAVQADFDMVIEDLREVTKMLTTKQEIQEGEKNG